MVVRGSWQRAAHGAGLLSPDGRSAPTIFAEMSALATRTGAINLGQGFPDEDGPAAVLAAAVDAIRVRPEPVPAGDRDRRSAPGRRGAPARFYGIRVDPDTEVLVTAGATEAIAATLLALLEPGDEVVTFEPFYDAYGALIALADGVHRTVPLTGPDFLPDPDALRSAVTDRTRVILVNSPHNPTGSVLPLEILEVIVELAHRHDAIIVTDEVYEHLTFGVAHLPIASLPGARERTVSISSGGKTFNTTGWKVGWITAPAELVTAILAVKQFLTYVNAAPFQPAIAVGLRLGDDYFTGIAADLEAKRDVLSAGLRSAGFEVAHSHGTYFVVADAAPLGFTDAVDFCRQLPDLAGVVAIPLSAFCRGDYAVSTASLVRFAFCKRVDVLERAAAQLAGLRQRSTTR